MTDTNTKRVIQKLWKERHSHDETVATQSDLIILREIVERQADNNASQDTGAHVHLVSDDAQTIAVDGEQIEWDREHSLMPSYQFNVSTFPATAVTIPIPGYYNVDVGVEWASHTSGGSVWIIRTRNNATARVWPPPEDPGIWTATDGQRGSFLASAIPCETGDTLEVYVDHDDASTQDLAKATLAVYLVEGFGAVDVATTCPTLGSEITVDSSSHHNGFPGFVVADDDTYLTCYREGAGHSSTDGIIVQRTSTDDGATWGSQSTIFSNASYDLRGAMLTKLSTGRIVIAVGARDNAGSNITDGGFTAYSDDEGSTWSSFTQIDDGGFTDFSRLQAPIVETEGGDWLASIIGANTSEQRKVRVIKSTDDGSTWSTVASQVASLEDDDLSEPNMVRVGSTYLMLIRDNTLSGLGNAFKRTVSVDEGATWATAVEVLSAEGGRPTMTHRSNGDIVMAIRDNPSTTYPLKLVRSTDLGETWEDCQTFSTTNDKSAYAQCAEDAFGKLAFTYSDEVGSSATDDATLYFRKET